MQLEPKNAIEEAYRLQLLLKQKRAELKALEDQYKDLMDTLAFLEVSRVVGLERAQKLQRRSFIVSEAFRLAWPEHFNRLATVTLKAAMAEIPERDLEKAGALQTHELVSWEIISRPDKDA